MDEIYEYVSGFYPELEVRTWKAKSKIPLHDQHCVSVSSPLNDGTRHEVTVITKYVVRGTDRVSFWTVSGLDHEWVKHEATNRKQALQSFMGYANEIRRSFRNA